MKRFPAPSIDFSEPTQKARHDRMVEMVKRMLSLHKESVATKSSHDKTVLQRQIAEIDREIDRLVYQFYDLTDKEIAIIEQSTK